MIGRTMKPSTLPLALTMVLSSAAAAAGPIDWVGPARFSMSPEIREGKGTLDLKAIPNTNGPRLVDLDTGFE
jgi:hypothetical protein